MSYLLLLEEIARYRAAARLLWPMAAYSSGDLVQTLNHKADTLERLNRNNTLVFW